MTVRSDTRVPIPITGRIIAASVTVVNPNDFTRPQDFISDVAYGGGSTYFVVNAQFFPLNVPKKADVVFEKCRITLDLPGIPSDRVGVLDRKNPRLDAPGYFVMPLLTPREKVEVANEALLKGAITEIPVTRGLYGLFGGVSLFNGALNATADPTLVLSTLYHTPGQLPDEKKRYVVFMPHHVVFIEVSVEQTYRRAPATRDVDPIYAATYNGFFDLEATWKRESGFLGAPSAHPMTFADYPPFQSLSPEHQASLLAHFSTSAPGAVQWMPEQTTVLPNYPNPFNPETWIPYHLAAPADVSVRISDIQGQIVRTLALGHQRAGVYQSKARAAYWDSRNAVGEPVASGERWVATLKETRNNPNKAFGPEESQSVIAV